MEGILYFFIDEIKLFLASIVEASKGGLKAGNS
jgi:hypothetical protein